MFEQYSLVQALLERRSRRFARGLHLNGGPLAYQSSAAPQALSLEEEAALAFAACGVTGYALAELPYDTGSTPGAQVQSAIPRPSERAIDATIACCEYVYRRYGRLPGGSGPFRCVLAYQAHHLDADFYPRFYRSEAYAKG